MKRVSVLGSTGSVGESALRVIEAAPDRFTVVGLAAGSNFERLAKQIEAHNPRLVSLCSGDSTDKICALLGDGMPEAASGEEGLVKLATMEDADLVLISVSGAAGLAPAYAAAKAGKTVALANKECLVMAGDLIMGAVKEFGATLLPVDSEHAGVFQALAGRPIEDVARIILPASGGPFRDVDPRDLEDIKPEQALNHPTWSMGRKITIDSATLMNKALELIEAKHLFGLPHTQIDVVIHPQSIIHGVVEFNDGSMVAQMSVPDMRLPILHALAWPERIDADMPRLNLVQAGYLTFEAVDPDRFPAVDLARKAIDMGGTAPAVLCAADEAAVNAFLDERISFNRIVPLIGEVLSAHEPAALDSIEAAMEADKWAREEMLKVIGGI